jgi:hypothetical protein
MDAGYGILDARCSIGEGDLAFFEYPLSREALIEYRPVTEFGV